MRALKIATFIVALALAYAALLCHPDPLFAYSVRAGAVALHSPKPLPLEAQRIAQAVDGRVARSPLYDTNAVYHVYLCETPQRFAFFAPDRWRIGGVVYGWLTPNAFLRPAHIARDRLLSPNGKELPGERTLTHFIAHEVVHSMLSIRLGARRFLKLATWQNEGYADYVAKVGAFDYGTELQRYHQGAPELDPAKSGLYLRYHLTVSYWLDRRGLSVDQLLALPADAALVEDYTNP